MLTESNYESTELGLNSLTLLVKRCSQTELSNARLNTDENIVRIIDILCSLPNDYELEQFEDKIIQSLVTTALRNTELSNQHLIKNLFSKQLGITNKQTILKVFSRVTLTINPNINIPDNLIELAVSKATLQPSFYYAKLFLKSILLNFENPRNFQLFQQKHFISLGQHFLKTIQVLYYQTSHDIHLTAKIRNFLKSFTNLNDYQRDYCGLMDIYLMNDPMGLDDEMVLLLKNMVGRTQDEIVVEFMDRRIKF
jgi:hypothetical protein